uniref:Uncharacterized protein n=1 Tax=Rhizophora mucronata TaxID=61149 RepID=A0A2P2JPD7_RHIMU
MTIRIKVVKNDLFVVMFYFMCQLLLL